MVRVHNTRNFKIEKKILVNRVLYNKNPKIFLSDFLMVIDKLKE